MVVVADDDSSSLLLLVYLILLLNCPISLRGGYPTTAEKTNNLIAHPANFLNFNFKMERRAFELLKFKWVIITV